MASASGSLQQGRKRKDHALKSERLKFGPWDAERARKPRSCKWQKAPESLLCLSWTRVLTDQINGGIKCPRNIGISIVLKGRGLGWDLFSHKGQGSPGHLAGAGYSQFALLRNSAPISALLCAWEPDLGRRHHLGWGWGSSLAFWLPVGLNQWQAPGSNRGQEDREIGLSPLPTVPLCSGCRSHGTPPLSQLQLPWVLVNTDASIPWKKGLSALVPLFQAASLALLQLNPVCRPSVFC